MKKLLITLVVVIGLLVAADFGARALAESRAGEELARRSGTAVAPEVDIHGFPFLIQALRGEYDHITVGVPEVELGTVPLSATANLYDVALPLSEVFSGSVEDLDAQRADLQVRIPGDDFLAALGLTGVNLTAAPDGGARVATTVTVGSQTFPVQADVTISFDDGTLHLAATNPTVAGINLATLPTAVSSYITQALTFDVPLTGLPVAVETAHVQVEDQDVVISASTGPVTFTVRQ